MKDRLKYVIDSRYFDGTCLTSMSDGFHTTVYTAIILQSQNR